jgi:hypothetical protein
MVQPTGRVVGAESNGRKLRIPSKETAGRGARDLARRRPLPSERPFHPPLIVRMLST